MYTVLKINAKSEYYSRDISDRQLLHSHGIYVGQILHPVELMIVYLTKFMVPLLTSKSWPIK